MNRTWAALAVLALSLPVHTYADSFSREAVLELFHSDSWHVGTGIAPGDSFSYDVCDNTRRFLEQAGKCYHVRLDFYLELESRGRDTWVVQAEISADDDMPRRHIFLVDSYSMSIETDHIGADYADSISDTVLYLARFAHEQDPAQLVIGNTWGIIQSTSNVGSDLVVVSKESGDGSDVFALEFGLFEQSLFLVSGDLPFPTYGLVYDPLHQGDPRVLFSFELLEYELGGTTLYDPGPSAIPGSNDTITVTGISNSSDFSRR